MIEIEIHPKPGANAYALLRSRVHQAATWRWGNRAKTRLRHVQSEGWIDVRKDGRSVIAKVVPKARRDVFYLAEKLTGRLVAWFPNELASIQVHLGGRKAAGKMRGKGKRKRR